MKLTDMKVKRALEIKEELGAEEMAEVVEFLKKKTQHRYPTIKVISLLSEEFEFSIQDASACWFAWQIYKL